MSPQHSASYGSEPRPRRVVVISGVDKGVSNHLSILSRYLDDFLARQKIPHLMIGSGSNDVSMALITNQLRVFYASEDEDMDTTFFIQAHGKMQKELYEKTNTHTPQRYAHALRMSKDLTIAPLRTKAILKQINKAAIKSSKSFGKDPPITDVFLISCGCKSVLEDAKELTAGSWLAVLSPGRSSSNYLVHTIDELDSRSKEYLTIAQKSMRGSTFFEFYMIIGLISDQARANGPSSYAVSRESVFGERISEIYEPYQLLIDRLGIGFSEEEKADALSAWSPIVERFELDNVSNMVRRASSEKSVRSDYHGLAMAMACRFPFKLGAAKRI